jgi:hypothetical protein
MVWTYIIARVICCTPQYEYREAVPASSVGDHNFVICSQWNIRVSRGQRGAEGNAMVRFEGEYEVLGGRFIEGIRNPMSYCLAYG